MICVETVQGHGQQHDFIVINFVLTIYLTRLPASRSSSIEPEGHFSFFHPKVKVKERISLKSTSSLKK